MLRCNPRQNRLAGCGGIGVRGWTPAFAGVTNGAWAPWPEYNRHPGLEPGSIFRPSRQPAPVEDGPRLSRSGAETYGGRA